MSEHVHSRRSILTVHSACTLLMCALVGCGTSGPAQEAPAATEASTQASEAADAGRSRLIAADFVEAMEQIPALAPHSTSLRVVAPDSRFGEFLIAGLQHAGYDLRLVAAPSPGVLDYYTAEQLSLIHI